MPTIKESIELESTIVFKGKNKNESKNLGKEKLVGQYFGINHINKHFYDGVMCFYQLIWFPENF